MGRSDFFNRFTLEKNSGIKPKNLVLYLIITIIIIYIGVPTYGIIRDLAGTGEAVFILKSPLEDTRMDRPKISILEKIYNFFSPPNEEIPVPILQRIDLKGRVICSDKTPYVNGIIELRSKPRYTRTDDEGYFTFTDVEEGKHTISVLNEGGSVLVRVNINIQPVMKAKDAKLTRSPDGTFVVQIAVDMRMLENTMILKKDSDGSGTISGIEEILIGLEEVPGGVQDIEPRPETEEPEPIPKDPEHVPEDLEPIPEDPEPGPEEPGSKQEEFGPIPQPGEFNFGVFDTLTQVHYGMDGAVNVNIFGDIKRIAPGMKGTYQFTVDNGKNDYPYRYDVTFITVDTLPASKKIPMVYRLKADGVYVAGDNTTWCAAEELYQERTIDAGKQVKYTLEWYWPEGEKDKDIARLVGKDNYPYSLKIKVTAQSM